MLDLSGLATRQNPDGGWPYRSGSSCTEPTIYALLALAAGGESKSAYSDKGTAWLVRNRRPDGGWAPRPNVDQSTWVTALALLLPGEVLGGDREVAVRWLIEQSGRESSRILRIRAALTDGHIPQVQGDGWPWFPETAAWVTPTSFGLLALEKANRSKRSPMIEQRCASAREYLISHTCRDGGWNHGSTKALGYDSDSYPETTGQALLALHDVPNDKLGRSLERARQHLASCRSLEAFNWLRLGLLSHTHGQTVRDLAAPTGHASVPETAIQILADAAANGRNIFLE